MMTGPVRVRVMPAIDWILEVADPRRFSVVGADGMALRGAAAISKKLG